MEYIRLSDICDLQNGYAFKSTDYVDESNTMNCRMSNIRPGAIFDIEYSPKYLPDVFAEKYSEYLLKDGDIVIAMTDLAGDPKILGVPAQVITNGKNVLLNQRVGKLILKDNDIDFGYLKYNLSNSKNKEYYKKFSGGGLQINISKKDILNLQIPLHEKEEQLRISKKLDYINDLINIRKNEIEKLNNLIKSQFVEMFKNCDKVRLSEIANITMGQSPSSESYNDIGNGLPFFQGKADYGDKYTIVKHWTNQPSKLSYKGDVLMSVRAPVGPVNISSCDCCIGRGLCSISSKDGLTNNEFLFNALNTIQDEIASKGTGSTFKAITKNDVYNIELPLGTLELQNKFAQIVEQIDKQKFEFEKSLKKLEELQSSLMQEYFG